MWSESIFGCGDTALQSNMCQFTSGSYAAVQLNDSLFAPFPMNTAEVRRVTWHTIARNFRATTKAHPSQPKEARQLAGAYVRFAPLLALPPESSSGCMWMNTGTRWSQSDKSGNLNSGFLDVRTLGYFTQTRSPVGQLLQPWLVRIMQQKKVMAWLKISAWQQQVAIMVFHKDRSWRAYWINETILKDAVTINFALLAFRPLRVVCFRSPN